MMQCLWCGNEAEAMLFAGVARVKLGLRIWEIFGPTFLCPRCKRPTRKPSEDIGMACSNRKRYRR